MFEHLMRDVNRIEVIERLLNRDGDVVQTSTVGTGYGVFTGLSKEELSDQRLNSYSHASVLVGYTGDRLVLDTATRNYSCMWRCREYKLSKVKECFDVNGVFQGYRIYTENG